MNEPPDHIRLIYIGLAAIAGAVTSLSFMPWRTMQRADIAMTLFVGVAFAIFGVPWMASAWLQVNFNDMQAVCGLTYFGGIGAPKFIALILQLLRGRLGEDKP